LSDELWFIHALHTVYTPKCTHKLQQDKIKEATFVASFMPCASACLRVLYNRHDQKDD